MSIAPQAMPPAQPSPRPRRSWIGGPAARARGRVSDGAIARRRLLVTASKLLLPVIALGLLTLIAIWPQIDRATREAQIAIRRVTGAVEGASMAKARYRGTDEQGRPYTVTAETARQAGQDRIDLTDPKGDMVMDSGGWLLVQSREGVYLQGRSQLDLSRDVMLYRDDGMTLRTDTVAVDMKQGAAASNSAVHVEGPLGTLDAQGFTLFDKGAVIQFTGPARMTINGAE